jgi:plastocyanin
VRARAAVAGALVLGLLAGPGASAAPAAEPRGAGPAAPPAGTTVSDVVVGFTFVVGYASLNAPGQAVRLHPGDTVDWTNLDPVAHSISFEAMPTVLYLKKPGDKASMTFTEAGYYLYRCVEHPQAPGMTGLVFVSD